MRRPHLNRARAPARSPLLVRMLHALRRHETIFPSRRKGPETKAVYLPQLKQRGSMTLALILNALYREFLKAALPGMAHQRTGNDGGSHGSVSFSASALLWLTRSTRFARNDRKTDPTAD
jgi:hypothetical protein